jgi:NAD(P)-dependent dehydrogenase (short-subunit alcohol dehydrogenase family)
VAAKIEATEMLRAGLLAGVGIVVARAAGAGDDARDRAASEQSAALTANVAEACGGLGASVFECVLAASGDLEADDSATGEAVEQALAELGEVSLLLVDAASSFSAAHDRGVPPDGAGGVDGEEPASAGAGALVRALETSWRITQAVANASFIERGAAGRIVYIAPRPDAGVQADAARAGLENLARTLSIEWARYGISPLAIAPGAATSPAEIAALVGYLASPAGDYFSGCLLDLSGHGHGHVGESDRDTGTAPGR